MESETIELPFIPYPLSALAVLLNSKHPSSNLQAVLNTSAWSIDAEMVTQDELDERNLNGGEEVAIIPPVSGG